MPGKTILITGCDRRYFPLLQDFVGFVADSGGLDRVELGIFDMDFKRQPRACSPSPTCPRRSWWCGRTARAGRWSRSRRCGPRSTCSRSASPTRPARSPTRSAGQRVVLAGWCGRALTLGAGALWADDASMPVLAAVFAAYGIALAASEGAERALIAQAAPSGHRGAAFGWYAALPGLAALPGALTVGLLWERGGPALAFVRRLRPRPPRRGAAVPPPGRPLKSARPSSTRAVPMPCRW